MLCQGEGVDFNELIFHGGEESGTIEIMLQRGRGICPSTFGADSDVGCPCVEEGLGRAAAKTFWGEVLRVGDAVGGEKFSEMSCHSEGRIVSGDALCGFKKEDFDGVVSEFGDAGIQEIIADELYTERVIDEDLLASASLISFTASKEESNTLEGPLIGRRESHRKAFELTAREEGFVGDSPYCVSDGERELRDGEDCLRSLSVIGAKVFPWTETSPEP